MERTDAIIHYHSPADREPAIYVDAGGVPGRLLFPALEARRVTLRNARLASSAVNFERDGLAFVHSPTAVADLRDEAQRAAYGHELEALLKAQTQALEVVVFDHTVRTEGEGERPPARHAHNDYNAVSAAQRLLDVLGEERAQAWKEGHYGIVNVWRPIGATVERAPLAFVRPESVRHEDWVNVDIVYPDRRGHVTGLLPSTAHEWVFWPRMTPDEVAIFRVADSAGKPPVAHSAVDPSDVAPGAPTRVSLESRVLVRYA
ncbi:MAG: CmcJ/NvfI family oxidoreductase [Myxococcota bacterium]